MMTMSLLIWSLFLLTLAYPVGVIATACFGYRFELISVSAFALGIAALALSISALSLVRKDELKSKAQQLLLAGIPTLSLLNAVFYIIQCPKIHIIASTLLTSACCCYLSVKYGRPQMLKIAALGLCAPMVIPIGFLIFIALLFGNMRQDTVVQQLDSPSSAYYALVIDSSQGALGGDTHVDVYKNGGINLILFKITKKPQRVYFGDWGEFETMRIYWKDDTCLVINSVPYEIEP